MKYKDFVKGFRGLSMKQYFEYMISEETPTCYDSIFLGMNDKDRKAKIWIDKFMNKLSIKKIRR